MLPTLGARSFYASAPTLWNSAFQQIFGKQHHSAFLRKNVRHIFLFTLRQVTFLGDGQLCIII